MVLPTAFYPRLKPLEEDIQELDPEMEKEGHISNFNLDKSCEDSVQISCTIIGKDVPILP